MSKGTYKEFRDALRGFESGWDRARYNAGIIQDWQLDDWAGGPVEQFFPGYDSWAELSNDEWDAMSYRSMNAFGFVGYQFGEALLIDLGYYQADTYYGNGATTNTWTGTWTGKNGVTSLEDFMTEEAQERAIQEAFGYNLQVIQTGLAAEGKSLDAYLGETGTFVQNGQTVEITLTLSGILAAAHLRGAWGTLALLQNGAVSQDEYGTSILIYADAYGGFDTPSAEEIIAVYESSTYPEDTTDDGTDSGDDGGSGGDAGDGSDGGTDTGPGDGADGDDAGTTLGGGQGVPEDAPIIAAYFPEWGVYERDYTIADVPAAQLTHLIYGFAKIDAAGKLALYDTYAAVDKAFSAADSVDGVADTWDGQGLRGNFNQIAELKTAHPHLKTSIAVGGWTLSGNFSTMAASESGRDTFAQSVKDFLITYDMFDGIDLDWEYPGGGGLGSNAVSAEDGANYALLVQAIRDALDDLETETGRAYEISIAAPAGFDKIANFNLAGLEPNVDFFNVMAYDFYGAWDATVGHQAAMFDLKGNGYDVTHAVDLYQSAGVPSGKIVLGAPMYTRAWSGVDVDDPMDGWNAEAAGPAPGSFEAGVYDYKDLLAKIQDPGSAWKLYYDDEAQAAFVYNAELGIFSSIETSQTIALKSEWAQAEGLGGMMFWDLSNDATDDAESLLKAASDSWFAGLTFDEIAAGSQLEFEEVYGGDGVVKPIAEADTPVLDLGGGDDGTDDSEDDPDDTTGNGTDGAGAPDGVGGSGGAGTSTGTAGVTQDTADVVITWTWGVHDVVLFDPGTDTIFIDWIGADALDVADTANGVVFAVPSNDQSTTLNGVLLEDLSPANFTILDSTAEAEVLALVGNGSGGSDGPNGGNTDEDAGTVWTLSMQAQADADTVPVETIVGFDPAKDVISLAAGLGAQDFEIVEMHGAVLIEVYPVADAPSKTYLFDGVALADLSLDNFEVPNADAASEIASVLAGASGAHSHMHVVLEQATPWVPIDGFSPGMGDVIEIGATITADEVLIFEESGDALGQTVRFQLSAGDAVWQVIFTGFGLSDLDISNFSIANQDVLNEVSAAIGYVDSAPAVGGYDLVYDADGSNPAAITGATDAGGVVYTADTNADDIVGFVAAADALDFGDTSVHGLIVTKSLAGEIVIDSPWSVEAQIVQGVTFQDVSIDSFGIVGNEHLRQDIGGVISWEQGVGPRDPDTVYLRSHEYGVHEVVEGFDPASMTLSFLYFGTRERLGVEDTAEGLVISSLPSGQSVTLTGVQLADLDPAQVEFHHDQVMEDNLEASFGFDQNAVTLVGRTVLLTPTAPDGQTTDGWQIRDGDGNGSTDGGGTTPPGPEPVVAFGVGADSHTLAWSYGTTTTITGFDVTEDTIDFGSFAANQIAASEVNGDLVFEVLGNGGDFLVVQGVQAADLTAHNLTAPDWSTILDPSSALILQLNALGYDALS